VKTLLLLIAATFTCPAESAAAPVKRPSRASKLVKVSAVSQASASAPAPAGESSSTSTASGKKARQSWGAAWSNEIKTTRDKKGRSDGYELTSEASAHWMVNDHWGPMAGLAWKWEEQENLDYGAPKPEKPGKKKKASAEPSDPRVTTNRYVDSYYGGARTAFSVLGHEVKSDLLYARLGSKEIATKKGYGSFLHADAKSSIPLTSRVRIRTRARYWEYLRDTDKTGTDTRQWRAELNPTVGFKPVSFGLQNRITQKFRIGSDRYTVDTVPFLKLEKNPFELTLRAWFTPFVSGDGRLFAANWSSEPVYSAELEFSL